MRKNVQITFLWLAGLFLLTHSIVPHIHHKSYQEYADCHSEESEGIIDFLANVFHSDFDVETLEHFQVGKLQIVAPSIPAIESKATHPLVICEKEDLPIAYASSLPPDEPIVEGHCLRGPPLV